jgi:hypothetical protein
MSSSNVGNVPLDQCLENLKHSILQVIHHEQVSEEVRSFLTELVQAILSNADQVNGQPSGLRREFAGHPLLTDEAVVQLLSQELGGASRPYQVELSSPTGSILVTNSATGKVMVVSQEDLIRWARQQGLDR